ncbi:hypothetical protein QTO34_000415 [Cnephaeus nilssonii]|uniref:G-protein coupled receptors family 1 profile domain-containing protein n=1 Tax=Cnephaeus nilssonii TaxID=3371016 RepID=A0AA40LWH9_CNENI|nr:hypothetical protein QTO34_000415 [Eptesicus nilssonii]
MESSDEEDMEKHRIHLRPVALRTRCTSCPVKSGLTGPPLWGAFSPRPSIRVPMDLKGRSLRGEEVEVPPGLLGYMMIWAKSGVSVPIPVLGLRDESKVFAHNTTCVLNDPNFVLIGSFVAFFIPLTIMVITYFLTIYVLRRQALMLLHGHTEELPKISLDFLKCCTKKATEEDNAANPNQDVKPRRRKKKEKRPRGTMQAINNERKASKVLGIVFFVFLVMWCPFFITNILSVLCEESCNQKLMEKLLNVFVWIGYVCSGINPLVYTLFNKVYRRAFSNYLRCNYKPEKSLLSGKSRELLLPLCLGGSSMLTFTGLPMNA